MPKPLLPLDGRPLVAWALDAALGAELAPVVLVVGHEGRRVAHAACAGVMVVTARRWEEGIAHSVRAALDALDTLDAPRVGAVCIGLSDQPRVGPGGYRRLVAAYDAGATLAVATYGGERGNPVLVARDLWPEVRRLDGDEGARALMRRFPVVEVACDGTGDPTDVDTPDDLRRLGGT